MIDNTETAQAVFHPFATLFNFTWPAPDPWSNHDYVGELTWRMQYVRGPACGKPERSQNVDKKIFWKSYYP